MDDTTKIYSYCYKIMDDCPPSNIKSNDNCIRELTYYLALKSNIYTSKIDLNVIQISIYKSKMTDSWEDQDFNIPVLNVPNQEQLKRLEERRLVEESDNALTKDLFEEEDLVYEDLKQSENKVTIKPLASTEKKAPKKNAVNKHQENEHKQKEASNAAKLLKEMKLREREIFGEAEEYDEYAEYEDKYY